MGKASCRFRKSCSVSGLATDYSRLSMKGKEGGWRDGLCSLECRAHDPAKALRRLSCVVWDSGAVFSWSGMVSVQRLCFVNFGEIVFSGESPQTDSVSR